MKIVPKILSPGEFYTNVIEKNSLYWHHTAGGCRPDWTIDGWERDRNKTGQRLAVGTAWAIGGPDKETGTGPYDGAVYQAFEDKYWAYHLGTSGALNDKLNSQSVGIEICNYGPLTKTREGIYLTYVKTAVPEKQVIDLGKPFRGFQYYHAYSPAQLASVKELTLDICRRHPKIDPRAGIKQFLHLGATAFELNQAAQKGVPGLWSHTNVRADKFDVYPHPQLIELIQSF